MSLPTKSLLRDELSRVLAADLVLRERAHKEATLAATHEEAKPENDKDTRALEQSYLARGEARRVEEQRKALAEVEAMPVGDLGGDAAIGVGALVVVEDTMGRRLVWLAPAGGGSVLSGGQVHVVTPKSPLGQALLGGHADDECSVSIAGARRDLTIVRVA